MSLSAFCTAVKVAAQTVSDLVINAGVCDVSAYLVPALRQCQRRRSMCHTGPRSSRIQGNGTKIIDSVKLQM